MEKEFIENLKDEIMKKLDKEDGVHSIEVQEVIKNNGTKLTGFTFETDSNISPVIYINKAYEEYKDGRPVSEIADAMINTYHDSTYNGQVSADEFLNYEKMKDKIIVSAVGKEANEEMLKDMPHWDVLDVSVIAKIEVSTSDRGIGTVKINNQLMDKYGVSSDELMKLAWENMKRIHPVKCQDLTDIIKSMHGNLPEFMEAELESHRGELFVLNTDGGLNGGVYGFDKETLTSVCEQLDSAGIYIMPSSINEVIIAREDRIENPAGLSNLVAQVNATEVADDEVLTDNAYYFNSETQEMSIVDAEPEMSMEY